VLAKVENFYTPRAVTHFITDILNPRLGEKMLDPACGTGGFMTAVVEHQKKQANNVDERRSIAENVAGWEYNPYPIYWQQPTLFFMILRFLILPSGTH